MTKIPERSWGGKPKTRIGNITSNLHRAGMKAIQDPVRAEVYHKIQITHQQHWKAKCELAKNELLISNANILSVQEKQRKWPCCSNIFTERMYVIKVMTQSVNYHQNDQHCIEYDLTITALL